MTNGTNGWVFVSDEVYRAALTERDRARQVAAELRAENAILRQLVYWQWGGLVLVCGCRRGRRGQVAGGEKDERRDE